MFFKFSRLSFSPAKKATLFSRVAPIAVRMKNSRILRVA
jgi:hypothetical protein